MVDYKKFNEKLKNTINEGVAENMIIIDGVVGVGKSSLMKMLSKELNLEIFAEPVKDNPLLPLFYSDMERYGFALQVFFLNNRFRMIKEAQKTNGAIMDRAAYGDVIFAKMLGEQGNMSKAELDCYLDLFTNMMEHLPTPKLIIYLKTDVDSAIKKIQKRGRGFEQETPRQYWEDLNREYSDYFSSYSISPILEIDVSKIDFVNNEKDKEYVLELVKDKLEEINLQENLNDN